MAPASVPAEFLPNFSMMDYIVQKLQQTLPSTTCAVGQCCIRATEKGTKTVIKLYVCVYNLQSIVFKSANLYSSKYNCLYIPMPDESDNF